jgi:hypothetical protein
LLPLPSAYLAQSKIAAQLRAQKLQALVKEIFTKETRDKTVSMFGSFDYAKALALEHP